MTMGDNDQVTTEQRERSGRREQNKAENRTALLKAARAVFAEMGFGAAQSFFKTLLVKRLEQVICHVQIESLYSILMIGGGYDYRGWMCKRF